MLKLALAENKTLLIASRKVDKTRLSHSFGDSYGLVFFTDVDGYQHRGLSPFGVAHARWWVRQGWSWGVKLIKKSLHSRGNGSILLEVGCERNIMKKEIGELVQYVKDYANFHYEDGGWDVIAECWEDKDIIKVLTEDNATTEKEAIAAFKDVVAVWADRQADAENSRF